MLALELISDLIPPLKKTDTVQKALNWMADFRMSHLPIVDNGVLLGMVSEEELIEQSDSNKKLQEVELSKQICHIFQQQHIYDVFRVMAEQELTAVPILDAEQKYIGLISLRDIVRHIAEMGALNSTGAIIVLEIAIRDYSLSEVARLVESNNAQILSSYITSQPDSAKIELTLKVSTADVFPIIATFERFKYTVKSSFNRNEEHDVAKEHYNSLMRYLNV